MTYSAYQIWKDRLLIKKNGTPYVSLPAVLKILQKYGHTKSNDEYEMTGKYYISQDELDSINKQLKES